MERGDLNSHQMWSADSRGSKKNEDTPCARKWSLETLGRTGHPPKILGIDNFGRPGIPDSLLKEILLANTQVNFGWQGPTKNLPLLSDTFPVRMYQTKKVCCEIMGEKCPFGRKKATNSDKKVV